VTGTHRSEVFVVSRAVARRRRALDNRARRFAIVAAVAAPSLLAVTGPAVAAPAPTRPFVWHAKPPDQRPSARQAVLRKRTWLPRVRITEYYPAPEQWALGAPVTAPGLAGKHRIDWLYGALGLSMQGTGIGLDRRLYHIDALGRGAWVNRAGKPTYDGVHRNGPPYWRQGGYWRNDTGGVTFPLLSGPWSNGAGRAWLEPPAGISFAPGPGTPGLRYYRTIAVDPKLIPLGSRVYIPFYKKINGSGWFKAIDTGGAIKGRHIDVYRPPPAVVDDLGRNLRNQRILVVPPGS
jgi:3D (Asp-Asp-Asp) domain-containing protein